MKTKEELLKIYSAYLPYDLQISIDDEGENWIETVIGLNNEALETNVGNYWDYTVKPILYSMDMLTKEIEHKGESFVPMLKLAKIESDLFEWLDDDKKGMPIIGIEDTDFDMGSMTFANTRRFEFDKEIGLFVVNLYSEGLCEEKDLICMEHICMSNRALIDKLLEWHFNVFGLDESEYIKKQSVIQK